MSKHRRQPTSFRIDESAGEGALLRLSGEQIQEGEPKSERLITTGIPLDKENSLDDQKQGDNHLT